MYITQKWLLLSVFVSATMQCLLVSSSSCFFVYFNISFHTFIAIATGGKSKRHLSYLLPFWSFPICVQAPVRVCMCVCACLISCIFHLSSFAFCFSFTHENKWFMHASPPLTRYSIEILRIIDSSVVALIALCCYSFRYFFNSDYVD